MNNEILKLYNTVNYKLVYEIEELKKQIKNLQEQKINKVNEIPEEYNNNNIYNFTKTDIIVLLIILIAVYKYTCLILSLQVYEDRLLPL